MEISNFIHYPLVREKRLDNKSLVRNNLKLNDNIIIVYLPNYMRPWKVKSTSDQ